MLIGIQFIWIQEFTDEPPKPPDLICPILGYKDTSHSIDESYLESLTTTESSGNRWWAGSTPPWWNSMKAIEIQTTIKTPSTGESGSGWRYYALLSCIDYPGFSYDQIGFGACDENYYLIWSYTTHDFLGRYTYHTTVGPKLWKNTYYTFQLIVDDGEVSFNMYVGGWLEYTRTVDTRGNWFELNDALWVGFILRSCFTLYEEGLVQDIPDNDLKFQNTQYIQYGTYSSGYWDSWVEYYASVGTFSIPDDVDVTISTTQHYVFIDNTP